MDGESESTKNDLEGKIAVYITYNGLPLFYLPYSPKNDDYILMSSFLHTIDILAKETRENIGKSADFYGFALLDKIQVEILEFIDDDLDSKDKIRLFLQTPYGRSPVNRTPIATLFGATRAIISKIKRGKVNPYIQNETIKFYQEKLKESGYTSEKVMSELKYLKPSQIHSSKVMPIMLFSIEEEEDKPGAYKLEEIGNYNHSKYKSNPVRNEDGKLTFEADLIIGLAEALKTYQTAAHIKTEAILLRFRDYSLSFSYKEDGLPVISVFIMGQGDPMEMNRYLNAYRQLELESGKWYILQLLLKKFLRKRLNLFLKKRLINISVLLIINVMNSIIEIFEI